MTASSEPLSRQQRQYQVRTLMSVIALVAVVLGLLREPWAWLLLAGPLALLVAMVLAGLGLGLFALADWLAAWLRRATPEPGPVDEWWN
jgi:hypothetical protein